MMLSDSSSKSDFVVDLHFRNLGASMKEQGFACQLAWQDWQAVATDASCCCCFCMRFCCVSPANVASAVPMAMEEHALNPKS